MQTSLTPWADRIFALIDTADDLLHADPGHDLRQLIADLSEALEGLALRMCEADDCDSPACTLCHPAPQPRTEVPA